MSRCQFYVVHYFLFMQLFSVCRATCFIFLSWQCSVCANYMHAIQITFFYNVKNSYAPANAVCINQCSMMLSMFLKAKCTKTLLIYQVSLYFINSHYICSQCQSFRFVKKYITWTYELLVKLWLPSYVVIEQQIV